MTHKIEEPDRFKVLTKRCDKCPFSKNQTTVTARRLAGIKGTLRRTNRPFMCHKTLELDLVCRGYFDTEGNLVIGLARYLGRIEYMTAEEAKMEDKCRGHMRHRFTDSVGEYRPDCRRCHMPNPRCPMRKNDERKPCGRKTIGMGYCVRHRPTVGAHA